MEGFTVGRANQFVRSGEALEFKSSHVTQAPLAKDTQGGKSFADTLTDAVGQVNEAQKTANKAAQKLAAGQTDNIPEVMISAEKADIALKLMVQVRNKVIDAYHEVMKMQV